MLLEHISFGLRAKYKTDGAINVNVQEKFLIPIKTDAPVHIN